jgi:UDP-N-acetylglucosamine acyltransferase
MANVHPSAVVSSDAELAPGVSIGPGCVIQGRVKIGANVQLIGNVYITGPAEIGDDTVVYPFACLGFPGQDFKFKPGMETAGIRVGQGCIIREHATIHAATKATRPTTVGDRCMLMVNAHVGHDVVVGNNVVMVNNSALGGHSQIGDNVTLSAGASVHQFTRVGRYAFFSGGSMVSTDVPPFCTVTSRQLLGGINRVGLRRAGFTRDHITRVNDAFRTALRGGLTREEMLRTLQELGRDCPPVMEMATFVSQSTRSVCVARRIHSGVLPPGAEIPLDS